MRVERKRVSEGWCGLVVDWRRIVRATAVLLAICVAGAAWAQQPAPVAPKSTTVWPATSTEQQVEANPAIWRVKGVHGTVYLFGSIHVMKPNVHWETDKVKQALDSSSVVYLEVANLNDTAAAAGMAAQFGMDKEHPLSSKMSKDDVTLLDSAAKSMGLPGEQMFEPMQPWLASMTISILPMLRAGYAPSSGIDTRILAEAQSAHKEVRGLETLGDQIHTLADLPQEQQVEMLHRELTDIDKAPAEMNEMVEAWERGDVEAIAKRENDELAAKHPMQYQRMVVDRNQRWTATLDTLLKDKETGNVFVVVGAAHLAGPDSVVKMLEKDGWSVERE